MIREAQEKLMVVFYGEIDRNKAINYLKDMASSIYINSKCIYGDNYLEDKVGNYKFNISKDSFFQVNHNQTIKLYDKVLEYLGTKQEKVLDLYCGIGTIGTYISIHCNHVLGIEINKSAIKDANLNKKLNKINNISFEHGDVGKLINSSMDYDTIIVDPPRSGLDKKTRNVLKKIETDKIIYVSCNPITLVRDINDLKDKYELIDLTLVDMFPNTYHVESICVLNKR
jgi:23S rRNA (uracil-5-)-methyltransferase RumA